MAGDFSSGASAAPVPSRPAEAVRVGTPTIPSWVKPLSASICLGGGVPESVNGLGFTNDADLLLYRKLSKEDYARYPMLEGVSEVWIVYRMNWEVEK